MKPDMKAAFEAFMDAGHGEYGETITRTGFLRLFGIEAVTDDDMQDMTMSEIRQALQGEALAELSAAGYVRDRLLDKGRYFARDRDAYRVALPSENADHAARYLSQAKRKTAKATKLLEKTPASVADADNTAVRLARLQAYHTTMDNRIQ